MSSALPAQPLTSAGVSASSAVAASSTIARSPPKGIAPTSAGGAKTPVFTA
jgi:hypothetical protein